MFDQDASLVGSKLSGWLGFFLIEKNIRFVRTMFLKFGEVSGMEWKLTGG